MSQAEFDKRLAEGMNPFPYPHPPEKPPFIIGGDALLSWFDKTYRDAKRQEGGTLSYFIIGRPGAGKTYFLNHLGYLFYEQRKYQGIYAHVKLSDLEFPENSIWKELFGGEYSKERVEYLVQREKIKSANIRRDIKDNLLGLLDGRVSYSNSEFREIAEKTSSLLPEESVICVALDNVEEYIDARRKEKDSIAYAVRELMTSIRNMTDPLKKGMVILAITDEVWPNVEKELSEIGRTKARRSESAEDMILGTLSFPESLQLVHEYMKFWSTKNGLTLPSDRNECLCTIGSKPVSIYPFTTMAIEFAHKMTDKLPGDISCFCGKCIDIMSHKDHIEVVKDRLIIEALQATAKARKALGWVPNAQRLISEMGSMIQEESLLAKLEILKQEVSKERELGLEIEAMTDATNQFANLMGVQVLAAPSVPSCINDRRIIAPNPQLKIWSFENSKFAVRYDVGDPHLFIPTVRLYGDRVNSEPYEEIMSLIKSQEATHGLLVFMFKVEDRFKIGNVMMDELKDYGTTIQPLDLTDKIYDIMAVVKAREEKELLARLVDRLGQDPINLKERLKVLSQQKKPEYKPPSKYEGKKLTEGNP